MTDKVNLSTAKLFIEIFTHLELCLADATHNYFKWVKIIQIWQNGGQQFWNLIAGWYHVLSLTYLKADIKCANE